MRGDGGAGETRPASGRECRPGKTEGGRRRGDRDEVGGWHHRRDGLGFGWTPGVGDGQGGLACCGSWGRKTRTRLSDWTELSHLGKSDRK